MNFILLIILIFLKDSCFSNGNKKLNINISKHANHKFVDFCPGVGKNIDCFTTGDFIYLSDAFYGVSLETP